MSLKTWMLGKMNRAVTRSDLPPRHPPRQPGPGPSPREPGLHWTAEGQGDVATSLEHLGAYGPLIAAVRAELEHFVTGDLRLHLAIAEHDRYLLTSIEVEDSGSEDGRELLQRFTREFAPEQLKHYLAKEIIARLPYASAIDLSQFAGLNAGGDPAPAEEEAGNYAELIKELRSVEPVASKHHYEVTLIGRWSETDARARDGGGRRAGATVTPLAGRALAIDIEDADGSRTINLSAVVPGRRYVVGKDPSCDVVVNGVYASRRHCEFWMEKGSWWIAVSGSTNGIRVESGNVSALERRQTPTRAKGDGSVLEVEPGAHVVLSASARGDPSQYPRLILRPLTAAVASAAAKTAATPLTPIALAQRPTTGLSLAVRMASGEKNVDLPQEPGPFRVGRSRTQGLVIDWAHEGVSGHHVDIIEPDQGGARVVVHGGNGVTVAGAAYAPGTEFRWNVGETMIFGRAGQHEPECSMTLSRRS